MNFQNIYHSNSEPCFRDRQKDMKTFGASHTLAFPISLFTSSAHIHTKQAGRASCSPPNKPCLCWDRDHGIFHNVLLLPFQWKCLAIHHLHFLNFPNINFFPFYHTTIMNLYSNLSVTLLLSVYCTTLGLDPNTAICYVGTDETWLSIIYYFYLCVYMCTCMCLCV